MHGFVLSLMFFALVGCTSSPEPKPFSDIVSYTPGNRIAVVGDLQRTSRLEFWREQNDAERHEIVVHIATNHPALVVVAGDAVFDGSSAKDWAEFDQLVSPIRELRVPTLLAAGNHEYWGNGIANQHHFLNRFPLLAGKTHTSIRFGPLAIVVIDSNIDVMASALWHCQLAWLEDELGRLDGDVGVRGVVAFAHHPPFTNSSVTGDEVHMQRDVVPVLGRSKKFLLLVSGHVHSYERFERDGRQYIVTGGGGGPRAELLTGTKRRHQDDRFDGAAIRPFQVVWLTPSVQTLDVQVMGIEKGDDVFRPVDSVDVPWPTPSHH